MFLDSHPAEVLTLILESRVRPGNIAAAFNESGLTPYLYAHQPGQPFPTLRTMIATGKRLVVFTDQGGGAYPGCTRYGAIASKRPGRPTGPRI